jgi:uncharacterized protein
MSQKGRPKKTRYIQKMPGITQFSPRGKPGRPDEVELTLDEFEAIKLSDYQKFSQSQGAAAMRLSRPTFGRILREARKKIANALVGGKTIRIRMGDAQVGILKKEITADVLNRKVAEWQNTNKKVAEELRSAAKRKAEKVPLATSYSNAGSGG